MRITRILGGLDLVAVLIAVGAVDPVLAAPACAVGCGAPGPVAGAGLLPILAVGYGAFWLARRLRHKPDYISGLR